MLIYLNDFQVGLNEDKTRKQELDGAEFFAKVKTHITSPEELRYNNNCFTTDLDSLTYRKIKSAFSLVSPLQEKIFNDGVLMSITDSQFYYLFGKRQTELDQEGEELEKKLNLIKHKLTEGINLLSINRNAKLTKKHE